MTVIITTYPVGPEWVVADQAGWLRGSFLSERDALTYGYFENDLAADAEPSDVAPTRTGGHRYMFGAADVVEG